MTEWKFHEGSLGLTKYCQGSYPFCCIQTASQPERERKREIYTLTLTHTHTHTHTHVTRPTKLTVSKTSHLFFECNTLTCKEKEQDQVKGNSTAVQGKQLHSSAKDIKLVSCQIVSSLWSHILKYILCVLSDMYIQLTKKIYSFFKESKYYAD